MSIGKRIKELLNKKNKFQKELAMFLKVRESTVSDWISGRSEPNPRHRKEIAKFLKVEEADLFVRSKDQHLRPAPPPFSLIDGTAYTDISVQKVPIISWIQANIFETISELLPSDEYVYTTSRGGKNMFALRVKNDCMEPEFREGDIINVMPNIDAANGSYVIIGDSKAETATFKQLKKYGDNIILHPLNPKYEDIELDQNKQYKIIGVVKEKVKKY